MSVRCVVYNASYEPLAIVSAERGLILHMEGRAVIVEELPDRRFRSARQDFPVPTAVVLKRYQKSGSNYYDKAPFNQRNLFVRDEHACQYCGRHALELKAREFLTCDHVHPQSRGGADGWLNCVTACSSCNHKKDDRTPEEAGLVLRRRPKVPTVFEVMMKRSNRERRRRDG